MASKALPGFDDKHVQAAIDAAQSFSKARKLEAEKHGPVLADGELKIAAQCISVTVQNGQICVNLPLGIGSVCLPIPSIFPSGTAAQACIDICTKWGIPCGVELTVSIAGQRIVQKGFGCSC
jgi:hypothetical protein